MHPVDVVLLVLTLTLAAALGARRLRTPMPVVLAAVGIALGAAWHLVPGLPAVHVPPERVLLVFLPPLLTSAAYRLPLGAFRRNLRPIALLAVGLVLATTIAAAATAHVATGLPWATAFVLGAIVAPPDPVAATAVAGQTGLAHRLVVILEGEGLVNDAVAIVAYHLAVQAATTGHFTWGGAALAVAREAPTGVLIGFAIGWATTALRRRLDDVTLEAGISLLVPYVTYEVADQLGASGVLAVVTFGFVLQRHATQIASPATRLAARAVWGAVEFASTALVFFLLGLLLGEELGAGVPGPLVAAGAAVAGATIALRMAWMYVVPSIETRIPGRGRLPAPTWRERTVLGWAGMRGVVSLALALALPALPGSDAVPGDARRAVILLTFAVIVATLVGQGVTLLPLITRLGVGDPARNARDERRTRARARRAALAALARAARADPARADAICALRTPIVRGAIGVAAPNVTYGDPQDGPILERALDAQRAVVHGMRDAGRIGGALAEQLATESDVDATRVCGDAARLTGAADD